MKNLEKILVAVRSRSEGRFGHLVVGDCVKAKIMSLTEDTVFTLSIDTFGKLPPCEGVGFATKQIVGKAQPPSDE